MKIINQINLDTAKINAFVHDMDLPAEVVENSRIQILFEPSLVGDACAFVSVQIENKCANGVSILLTDFSDNIGTTFEGYRVARLLGDWLTLAYKYEGENL